MAVSGSAAIAVRLVHYLIVALGIGVAMQNAGIQLNALFAAGAVFAIGFGFAMQNIAQNFVSGVILLVERTIRPGDVIEVDGVVVQIESMGIRATLARTRDDETLVIPNATLVQGTVKSFTLRDPRHRVRASVGVAYTSDLKQVRATLLDVGRDFEERLSDVEPVVLLEGFGASTVDFELSVWIDKPWEGARTRSALREAIWFAFLDRGITIAFQQVDLHLDAPVTDAIRRLATAA